MLLVSSSSGDNCRCNSSTINTITLRYHHTNNHLFPPIILFISSNSNSNSSINSSPLPPCPRSPRPSPRPSLSSTGRYLPPPILLPPPPHAATAAPAPAPVLPVSRPCRAAGLSTLPVLLVELIAGGSPYQLHNKRATQNRHLRYLNGYVCSGHQ
mmetsp:Transcript_52378/g.111592  ORF Transcript_52378/g.111592 Transcript_52378/m.111592 type:complete len:155 (-) Transcript_52378:1056-1520(-)